MLDTKIKGKYFYLELAVFRNGGIYPSFVVLEKQIINYGKIPIREEIKKIKISIFI